VTGCRALIIGALAIALHGPLQSREGANVACDLIEVEQGTAPRLAFSDLLPFTLRIVVANHGAPRIVIADPRETPLENFGFEFYRHDASDLKDARAVPFRGSLLAARVGPHYRSSSIRISLRSEVPIFCTRSAQWGRPFLSSKGLHGSQERLR
jgi:hypothetical protein